MKFDFTGKLGPLPVWVWGLLIGGIVVVWMWVSGRQSPDAVEPAPVGTTPNGPGGDFSQVPILPSGTPVERDRTNAEWLAEAVNAVVNRGVGSTLATQSALQKYLSGQPLTQAETTLVDSALSAVGLPPQGTAGIAQPAEDVELSTIYFRKKGDLTGDIWAANADGSRSYIDYGKWLALGKPAYSDIPPDYTFWKRPVSAGKP